MLSVLSLVCKRGVCVSVCVYHDIDSFSELSDVVNLRTFQTKQERQCVCFSCGSGSRQSINVGFVHSAPLRWEHLQGRLQTCMRLSEGSGRVIGFRVHLRGVCAYHLSCACNFLRLVPPSGPWSPLGLPPPPAAN